MVLDYLDKETSPPGTPTPTPSPPLTLGSVIERAQEIPPEEGGFADNCAAGGNPVCMSAGALAQVGESYGLSVQAGDNWTKDGLWNALGSGHPIIVLIRVDMDPEESGHFVVVYGLDLGTDEVIYHDPLYSDGAEKRVPWETFDEVWKSNVDDLDPLQPGGHIRWGMIGY
jgi:hypothetical protein